jgi:hypothetical protein
MLKGQRTIFSLAHILQIGLFPHIRVTKFPPHLETKVPLAFASPDAWVSPSQWHYSASLSCAASYIGPAKAPMRRSPCTKRCAVSEAWRGPYLPSTSPGTEVGPSMGIK